MTDSKFEYINPDYLDLMTEGDIATKKVILEMLFEELPAELQKMKDLYHAQNWDDLWVVAHKMKSTLPFVGNEEMISANVMIEQSAKHGEDLQKMHAYFKVLEELYPKIISELEEIYNSI